MNNIKTIGLIAPSGYLKDIDEINKKIEILSKNYKVKKFYNENTKNRYLSDTDDNRIKYLEEAFIDDETDLILQIRGGYGLIRIIDKINYDLIKNIKNPNKYYCSSSDGSILLAMLSKYTNIQCFHSLMLTNGFIDNLNENIEIIKNSSFKLNLKPIKKGKCSGYLWGGNLSSIVSLFSYDNYLPNSNIILFLEDLNEPSYKVDKMLYEIYRNKELKEKINGIIFGDFYLNDNEINPILEEYSNLFNVPTYIDKNITHKQNNLTLPYYKYISI